MKKMIHNIAKVLLSLIIIFPVLGILGVFPPPTPEMYNTETAFSFISMLGETGYINWIMLVVNVLALFFLWTKREAFSALLLAPITVNIVGFHAFVDGGLLTSGAMLANLLLILNIYFLWKNRDVYQVLLRK